MNARPVYFWKKAPMFRLLLPLITGILLEWYTHLSPLLFLSLSICSVVTLILFFFLPLLHRYKLATSNGIIVFILFSSIGALLTYKQDITNNDRWFTNSVHDNTAFIASLTGPPVEKAKTLKCEALIQEVINDQYATRATGHIIIYLKKDSSHTLKDGTKLLFKKQPEEIPQTGNPGGFDYKAYSFLQGITHQVFLQPREYVLLPGNNEPQWHRFIYGIREKILSILRSYIKPREERGLAEALLIGYKDDLDNRLVQSYSNTGVVHIIAISGLHLGLVYWLLLKLFQPLKKRKKLAWLPSPLVICGLWIFTFLAGAQPSVLRSALMFTCIAAAESLTRKTSIYNTLALSAFLLLCYDPYWLWDVGFQLSYAAVLSIVMFSRPVYNIFYFKNKLLDHTWKLVSVSIAAQLLTLPVTLYYFHQFPVYFLLTNLVAIPLSSVILMGEIALCAIGFIPLLAVPAGKLITSLIWLMDKFIGQMETLPFARWNGLQVNLFQALLLLVFILSFSYWLLNRKAIVLKLSLTALLGFAFIRSCSFIKSEGQRKLIVYNVPQKSAMDIINGFHSFFVGDTSLMHVPATRAFYLGPSRILYRISEINNLHGLTFSGNLINFVNTHILYLYRPMRLNNAGMKQRIDLLVVSKNGYASIRGLTRSLDIRQVVIDASVPDRWATRFQKDCDSLRIPCHDVTVKGAFVMTLR